MSSRAPAGFALVLTLALAAPARAAATSDSTAAVAAAVDSILSGADTERAASRGPGFLAKGSQWTLTLDGGIGVALGPELFRELYEPGLGGGLTLHRSLARRVSASARLGYLNLPFDAGDNPFDIGLTYRAAEGALTWMDGTVGLELELISWLHAHGRAGYGYAWGRSFEIFEPGGGTIGIYNPDGGGPTFGGALSAHFPIGARSIYIECAWLELARSDESPDQLVLRAGSSIP
jgi:hypothetical protein